DGVALCTGANNQQNPTIVSDGAGGAIVAWQDYRSGSANADIYARRVDAAGTPQWTSDGVALCVAVRNQQNPTIVSDGAGGAIVAWEDYRSTFSVARIFARRISAAGTPLWTANGVALGALGTANSVSPVIASDGVGGAIVAWSTLPDIDFDYNIFAQRV